MFLPSIVLLVSPAALALLGDMTWYYPGGAEGVMIAAGACGETHSDGDFVAAASASSFDAERLCGRRARVTTSLGSVTVTIVDRCEQCAYLDLDLSPVAFEKVVGNLDIGRRQESWEWIS